MSTKVGAAPGKTLAIFGGVHGNERVGVEALAYLEKELNVARGTVHLVLANPIAVEQNVRLVNTNLNRLYDRSLSGESYEYARASELMDLLDHCDALLDIHSYNSETGDQFLITEDTGLELARKLDFPVVATGFSKMGSGSDSYMSNQGKVGITAECGTTNRTEHFLPLAIKTVHQFLAHFGAIDERVPFDSVPQRHVRAERLIRKTTEAFAFTRAYKDFEPLMPGEVFATDGATQHRAGVGECIIFPRATAPVGGEGCIVGSVVSK